MILLLGEILIFVSNGFNNNPLPGDVGFLRSVAPYGIEKPFPNGSLVSFFVGESRIFNISNNNSQNIKWYLNGNNIKNNSRSVEISGLEKGDYVLEVMVRDGEEFYNKSWTLVVEDNEKVIKFIFDAGKVIYLVILIVLLIIILLVCWLLIERLYKRIKGWRNLWRINPKRDPVLRLKPSRK